MRAATSRQRDPPGVEIAQLHHAMLVGNAHVSLYAPTRSLAWLTNVLAILPDLLFTNPDLWLRVARLASRRCGANDPPVVACRGPAKVGGES